MRRPAALAVFFLFSGAIFLAGCGGGSSTSSAPPPPPPNPNMPVPVTAPTVFTVAAGQNTSVNIAVPVAASSPTPNAQALGVSFGMQGSADNTGAQIKQGQTGTVLLFGPGLSGNMQISISGPGDIAVSNPQTIKATDGTPGVAFTVVVPPTAALGARTVILENGKQDITTFTGGLEVTQ
jgi:hypothetical protein